MMKKSLSYSAITLAVTLVIGQILLILFSEGNSIGSSVLFILMNLTPMFVIQPLLPQGEGRSRHRGAWHLPHPPVREAGDDRRLPSRGER